MRCTSPAARFASDPRGWSGVDYAIERDRGYDHVGDMRSPGGFSFPIVDLEEIHVSASSESWQQLESLPPSEAWKLELSRREHILNNSDPAMRAADTFAAARSRSIVVRPAARVVDEAQARRRH